LARCDSRSPYWLVSAQFILAALLVLTARILPVCHGCLVVAGAGAMLAVWAWLAIGLRRLNILPHVKADAKLVTVPPYRLIRHPMYTGLLVFCGGLLFTDYAHWKIAIWVLLVATLDIKARLEERLLSESFPAYEAYRQRTRRFVPFVY